MEQVKRESSRTLKGGSSLQATTSDRRQSGLFARARSSRGGSLPSRSGKDVQQSTNGQKTGTLGAGHQDLVGFTGVFPVPEASCKPDKKPALTEEQETKYKTVLDYFKAEENQQLPVSLQAANNGGAKEPTSDWEKLRMLSRESILRYLRATKWDVKQAQKRIIETIAWRREFGIDDLDPEEMAKEAKSGKETVLGYDNRSRPLHYMHPHRNDTKESPRQMQFAVWILERCIDLMPPGQEQLALLINFDQRSRNPTSIANAKLMLYILQNHYVERLGIALCINVPWVFKMFWNAIQPFIDPVTKSKCRFDEAVKSEVPASQLSADFGGKLDPKYDHDAYFPELVKVCDERREAMMRRFREDCKSELGASEWVIRGGDDPTSPFNVMLEKSDGGEEIAGSDDKHTSQRAESEGTSTDKSSVMTGTAATSVVPSEAAAASGSAVPKTPDYRDAEPIERFRTPSETLNATPLDRHFSRATISTLSPQNGAHESLAAITSAETTEEQDAVGERPTPAQASPRSSSFAHGWAQFEGGMTRGFKGVEHKFHNSKMFKDLNAAFHPDSRRGSSDSRRSDAAGKRNSSTPASPRQMKSSARPTGAVAAAPTSQETESAENSADIPQLPSAVEAVALAGAAGSASAASAIGAIAAEHASLQLSRVKSQASTTLNGMMSSQASSADDGQATDAKEEPVNNGLVAVALPHEADEEHAGGEEGKEGKNQKRTVTMLFFAAAKDAAGGKGRVEFALPTDTPSAGLPLIELAARLLAAPPAGADVAALEKVMKQSKWSIDEEMIDDEQVSSIIIRGGEDIAIIPPVSGG